MIRERLPESFLMGAFAAIIVVAGLRMLNHRPDSRAGLTHPVLALSIAASVGLLTGMLGVGGGFLGARDDRLRGPAHQSSHGHLPARHCPQQS